MKRYAMHVYVSHFNTNVILLNYNLSFTSSSLHVLNEFLDAYHSILISIKFAYDTLPEFIPLPRGRSIQCCLELL
jgi:hypothetical protein